MRLTVRCPAGWQERVSNGARLLVHPDGRGGELRVELRDVAPLPEDPRAWIRAELGTASVLDTADQELASGWPAFVVEAADGDDRLLVIVWRFLEHGAAAFTRCPAEVYEACRVELLAVLGDATLAWEGQPLLTLAQIWDGFDLPGTQS